MFHVHRNIYQILSAKVRLWAHWKIKHIQDLKRKMATPPGKDGDDGSGQARTFDEGHVVRWNWCWNPKFFEMFALCLFLQFPLVAKIAWFESFEAVVGWIEHCNKPVWYSGRPLSTSSRPGWLPAAPGICRNLQDWYMTDLICHWGHCNFEVSAWYPAAIERPNGFWKWGPNRNHGWNHHFSYSIWPFGIGIYNYIHVYTVYPILRHSHYKYDPLIVIPCVIPCVFLTPRKHPGSLRVLRLPLELQINCSCRPFKSSAPHWRCCLERTGGASRWVVSIACVVQGCPGPSSCALNECLQESTQIFVRCWFPMIPPFQWSHWLAIGYPLLPHQDLSHWTAPIIGTTIKVIAVVISSYIQAVISAFYSGIRGGRLFGEALGDPRKNPLARAKLVWDVAMKMLCMVRSWVSWCGVTHTWGSCMAWCPTSALISELWRKNCGCDDSWVSSSLSVMILPSWGPYLPECMGVKNFDPAELPSHSSSSWFQQLCENSKQEQLDSVHSKFDMIHPKFIMILLIKSQFHVQVVLRAAFLISSSGRTSMRCLASLLPPQIGCIFCATKSPTTGSVGSVLRRLFFWCDIHPEFLGDHPVWNSCHDDMMIWWMDVHWKTWKTPQNSTEVGFYWQITHGFALEFPYSLIMLPCTIVEWVIRWHIYTWARKWSHQWHRWADFHKVFHDSLSFAAFFCVPFGPRKSLQWQWYWK